MQDATDDELLLACLPEEWRDGSVTITRMTAGWSGAGVYRVDGARGACVLKVAPPTEPAERWHPKVELLRCAAERGLAPGVMHVDEARRAVVSDFVQDRGFPPVYHDPRTHDASLAMLAGLIRGIHALPVPQGMAFMDGREYVAGLWKALDGFPVPSFVADTVELVLSEELPGPEPEPVLSHNDLNPTNLVYDGSRVLLLDWDTAGANDPNHDLATVSLFLRMDGATCLRLLSEYGGEQITALPERFVAIRRRVAAMVGAGFLTFARKSGHAGGDPAMTVAQAPSLAGVYPRLRSGELSLGTPEGRFEFGLALIRAGIELPA